MVVHPLEFFTYETGPLLKGNSHIDSYNKQSWRVCRVVVILFDTSDPSISAVFYVRYTTHGTNGLTPPSEGRSNHDYVSC